MKPGSVIHRYIFRELMSPFFISLAFLLFVFLMTGLIDITDYVVNYQVGLSTVLMMLVYNMPLFLRFVIPMAVMIGVLLTFLKMSSDNEIIALKAGGMSIYAMLPPVIVFCVMGWMATTFMTVYGEPWSRISTKSLVKELNTASLTTLLPERSFNTNFDGRIIYATKVDPLQNALEGVFIEDRSASNRPFNIIAPRGRLMGDPDTQIYHLLLEQAQLNRIDIESKSVSTATFDTLQVRLDLNQSLKSSEIFKREKDMTLGELREYLATREERDERYNKALTIFHAKFSLPFACVAMGILAVPLGIRSKSARRSFGIGLGIFFFLGYYLILSAGEVYGKMGIYPPVIGMWAPNIVMGGIGCFLLVRCARERGIGIGKLVRLLDRRSRSDSSPEETSSASHNP